MRSRSSSTNIDDERIFVIAEALRRGISVEEINAITKVDLWFLERYQGHRRHGERASRTPRL